jgi:hypothetical protein
MNGIRAVSSMLTQGKLKFHRMTTRATIEEMRGYIWDEAAALKGEEKPVKERDHGCLSGDTFVDTSKGKRRIRDLAGKIGWLWCADKAGRKRRGFFWNVHRTKRNAEIWEAVLSDGTVIRGTEEHPVLTRRGWVPLSKLLETDEVRKINV